MNRVHRPFLPRASGLLHLHHSLPSQRQALHKAPMLFTARGLAAQSVPTPRHLKGEHYTLAFTCTHEDCSNKDQERRAVRMVSKAAYDHGVVLVRCKCDKLHLMADRLGWFEDGGTDIEKILAEKNLSVFREKVQVDDSLSGEDLAHLLLGAGEVKDKS